MEHSDQTAVNAKFKELTEGLTINVGEFESVNDPEELARAFYRTMRDLEATIKWEHSKNTTDIDIVPMFISMLKHLEQLGVNSDSSREIPIEVIQELDNKLRDDLLEQPSGLRVGEFVEIRGSSIVTEIDSEGRREIITLPANAKIRGIFESIVINPIPLESDLSDFHDPESDFETLEKNTNGQHSLVMVLREATLTDGKYTEAMPEGHELIVPLYLMRTKVSRSNDKTRVNNAI